ncbi:MAG: cytochrome c peroxidase [Thermodesulfobacteriota bacterium]
MKKLSERMVFRGNGIKILAATVAFLVLSSSGWGKAALGQGVDQEVLRRARALFKPLPESMLAPKDNPTTPAKAGLGKMLFVDERLSASGAISCLSCHPMGLYLADQIPFSVGHLGKLAPRNSPTLFNAGLQFKQHWRGDRDSLEHQVLLALVTGGAFANKDRAEAMARLRAITGYAPLFKEAFPGEKESLTYDNIAKSIAAFQRTLITPAPFDSFLRGNLDALTAEQKKGLGIFIDTGCAGCHSGPGLGGNMYSKFGMVKPYWPATGSKKIDKGRYDVTGKKADMYLFKVPMLRNVARTPPYFHDGSVRELRRAVRVMADVQLGKMLTDEQAEAVVAFLESLTGEIPADALAIPILPASPR